MAMDPDTDGFDPDIATLPDSWDRAITEAACTAAEESSADDRHASDSKVGTEGGA